MFLLQDLPDQETLDNAEQMYGPVNQDGVLLFLKTLKTGSDLLNNLDQFLATYGLKHGRWITLVLLIREPMRTTTPSELSKKQGVTRATMTNLLNSLENDSYIKRVEHPVDSRATQITLTRKGVQLLNKIMPQYYELINKITKEISERQLKATAKLLEQLSQKTEEYLSH
ncbi:MarR family transcriptional regulator [Planctomycetota bacterium]|nr:MarR family transcriptional regulator [Planctomycetota bacterium]